MAGTLHLVTHRAGLTPCLRVLADGDQLVILASALPEQAEAWPDGACVLGSVPEGLRGQLQSIDTNGLVQRVADTTRSITWAGPTPA